METTNKMSPLLPDGPRHIPSATVHPLSQLDVVASLPLHRFPMHAWMHDRVMTDEQLKTLRQQISVYSMICQKLVEMHKAIMSHQSAIAGLKLGRS
eukprot:c31501_g1_i1 orf=2-286(-)